MNNDDDFKLAMEKFGDTQEKVHRIRILEDFLQNDDIKYKSLAVNYFTESGTKKEFVLIDSEKWGVIDSLCRELRDYKRDFMKAMGTIG